MSSLTISLIVFGSIFGGAIVGMLLRRALPDHHLASESKDVIKLGMGLIGTITALVLGLLVASAKSSFDAQTNGVAQLAANAGLLDRALAHYGPEANEAREQLRATVRTILEETWPEHGRPSAGNTAPRDFGHFYETLQALSPKTESQRSLQAAALKTAGDMGQARWQMFAQKQSAIPTPFLVVLVFWLAVLFASFGIYSPPNATIVITLLVSAASMAGAVFLVLELGRPFDGVITVSPEPLRNTLEHLGR